MISFLKGLFGELGKDFAQELKKRSFRKGEITTIDTDPLISEVYSRMRSSTLTSAGFIGARVEVERTLQEIGISEEVRQSITVRTITIIEHCWHV